MGAIKFIIFPVVLVLVEGLLILMLFNWIPGVNQNCATQDTTQKGTLEEPSIFSGLFSIFDTIWGVIKGVFTLGLSTICDFPVIALSVIVVFNTILYTFIIWGVIFLIRGATP